MSRRGFIVAFVGVDGSGKSSAVYSLLREPRLRARRMTRLYFGGNEYWIPGALRLNARLDSVPVVRFLVKGLLRLDRQLRVVPAIYYRWRGHLVVCDRYYFDDLVAKRHASRPSGLLRHVHQLKWWCRARMVCRPDLTFYLDVSPETAYTRKQDYAFEILQRMNRAYREEMASHPDVVFVDAERPQEDVQRVVVEHLERLQRQSVRPNRRIRAALGKRVTAASQRAPRSHHLREWLVIHGSHWHPRVTCPPAAVRAHVDTLNRTYGRGALSLTGSGALHHATPSRVRAIALGPLSAESLEANYRQWAALRAGPHAALVDYDCEREAHAGEMVYTTERLDQRPLNWADVEALRDQMRGEFRQDQFEAMSFDEARNVLAMRTGVRPDQADAFRIHPEPGYHGLMHGDFHWGNLRHNRSHRPVLIDLDRVQEGPQILDRIHCAVVHVERQRRLHWLSFFSCDLTAWLSGDARALLPDVSANSLRAYFLWRQSTELLSMSVPDRAFVKRLERCFHRLTAR